MFTKLCLLETFYHPGQVDKNVTKSEGTNSIIDQIKYYIVIKEILKHIIHGLVEGKRGSA